MINAFQEVEKSKGTALEATPLVLLSGAVLALSVGFVPLHPKNQSPPQNLNCASLDLTKELSHWAEVDVVPVLGCIEILEYD